MKYKSLVAAHDPSKRNFMALASTGVAGIALGGIAAPISQPGTPEPACSAKSVNAEYQVVKTFLNVVAVEIPSQKPTIDKILKIGDDFNADYQRGDFVNAAAIFATFEADITQFIADVGVNLSPRVKIALVLANAAVAAIGGLLKSQKGVPAVQSALMNATTEQQAQAAAIEKRAAQIDRLFAAIHP